MILGKIVLKYDEFMSKMIKFGVKETTVVEGLRILKRGRFKITKVFYNKEGEPVGAIISVVSRSRPGHEHFVTVGEEVVKCTCEDSVYNGNVCAHMVAALRLMWDAYKASGRNFPIEKALIGFQRIHGSNSYWEEVSEKVKV